MEDPQSASKEQVWTIYPRYNAAVLGFRSYWYPVMFSRSLGRKPVSRTLLGEKIVFVRDRGNVYALRDRCPHRGVPLSMGQRECPGTLTCIYHGWTFDLETGQLVAVLTDGPDSPICGKVTAQIYPVEERGGLIWVYVGDDPPPPAETDIPEELLHPDAVVVGVARLRRGNWRYAVENSIDEGHARSLHRSAIWMLFTHLPAWSKGTRMVPSEDGKWLIRTRDEMIQEDVYPRIGRWPRRRWWQLHGRRPGVGVLKAGLPCQQRIQQNDWGEYEYFVPSDEHHHISVLLSTKRARGLGALAFRLRFWLYRRWFYFGHFNSQDQRMIENMQIPPERLYRPDVSITAWRKWCQEKARGAGSAPGAGTTSPRSAEAEVAH